jgi:hypothetical protein
VQKNTHTHAICFCYPSNIWHRSSSYTPAVKLHTSLPPSLPKRLTEKRFSWEATWSSASHEIPRSLWNPKVYCRVHKSPPPVLILSQTYPFHTLPSYLFKAHFNIRPILRIRLNLPSGLFPSALQVSTSKPLTHFFHPPCVLHACPSHPPGFQHPKNTRHRAHSWSSSFAVFFIRLLLLLLWPKHLPEYHIVEHL